ncbi:hypothetical protein [Aliivibrio fischeri]|uniref:hypothetical protein n=1 Tax=Aliivibrio fischeri TaxID=668 RepID=UPI0012DA34C9|nr:hypothetical protein [Aliivibrio fischeri]MUJ37333.1 hypothetical protein [Aliivibrio fischeri]
MLIRKIATICILMATLLVLTLYSATSRAENLPTQLSDNHAVVEISHVDFCNLELGGIQSSAESGCCDPGGSCFEKQCCSHGHASSSSLVSNSLFVNITPYHFVSAPMVSATYLSADLGYLYRPPIS